MSNEKGIRNKIGNAWKYLIVGALLITLNWTLNNIDVLGGYITALCGLIMPFIVGGVIAFIFSVPMRSIEKHIFTKEKYKTPKILMLKRVCSYSITLIGILAIIVMAGFVVMPRLVITIADIISKIPQAATNLSNWALMQLQEYPAIEEYIKNISIDWSGIFKSMSGFLSNGTIGLITGGIGAVSGIFSGFASFFIGFAFSVYILFQKEKLSRQITKILYALFSTHTADKAIKIARLANTTFANFLSGQCLEAVILGTLFVITMSILRMPYALLIGVVISVTALVPIVGAFMGCIIGVILIALINPLQAVAFVIMFLILQQIEGNLIYPHVVGNSVGLPGMWVLAAVSIGGNLFGIAGMLTFIPICSVAYALFREFINNRLARKQSEALESREGLNNSDCIRADININVKTQKGDNKK